MPARRLMSLSPDEISPEGFLDACTTRSPELSTLSPGRKKWLKAKGGKKTGKWDFLKGRTLTKKKRVAKKKVKAVVRFKKGANKKRTTKARRAESAVDSEYSQALAREVASSPAPRCATPSPKAKASGWKLLKGRTLSNKTRVAKKKMKAVVRFKKGGKKKRGTKGIFAALVQSEDNTLALAREYSQAIARETRSPRQASPAPRCASPPSRDESETISLDTFLGQNTAPTDTALPLPISDASKFSYDKAWVEFNSSIFSLLRTTNPSSIPERILDSLDMKDVERRLWKRIRYLLVKLLGDTKAVYQTAGESRYFHRIMLCPEEGSSVWRKLLRSLELGKVCPAEGLTFGALLNLKLLRATKDGALSGIAPRWEQAVWRLTTAICELWDYDPVLQE
jgi:hypothetical protein